MSEARPLLLLARTGLIIRNLLLGTFARQVTAERPLVVAVPRPADPRLRALLPPERVELIPFDAERPIPETRLELLRAWQPTMYRFQQAARASRSIDIQTRLFEPRRFSLSGRLYRRALRGAGRVVHRLGLMGRVEARYLEAQGRAPITGRWRDLLEDLRPAALVSTMLTHATVALPSPDLPAVLAARALGIPQGTLVQSWDNLSSKTAILPPWLERVWTWSPAMSAELGRMHPRLPAACARVVGSPQFDFHRDPGLCGPREAFCTGLGLDPARPYLLVGTGTEKLLPHEPRTVLDLAELLRKRLPELQVLVRLHPKDDGRRWEPGRARLNELGVCLQRTAPGTHMDLGGFLPPAEFYREQVTALTHAAVVLNTASTLTVDAAIVGRPVVCLGYDSVADPLFPEGRARAYAGSSHYQPLVDTGGVQVARSAPQCLGLIARYLREPRRDAAGRRAIEELVTGAVDGKAGERLAAEALQLARSAGAAGLR